MPFKLKCPGCGQRDSLTVQILTTFTLCPAEDDEPTDDLTYDRLPPWSRQTPARCPECGQKGRVGDFEDKEAAS